MHQQDFFNNNTDEEKSVNKKLEEKFNEERVAWTSKVKEMSLKMKKVLDIPTLMAEIYTERQICVDYHHYLISILIKLNKEYRRNYSERHDYWSFKSNIRYPNENSKNNKILTELSDLVEKRELIENHSKYIDKTVSTIDNLIYAIPKRIEVEQISRGK